MGLDMYVYKAKAPPKDGKKIDGYTFWDEGNFEGPIKEWKYGYEGDPNHPEARFTEELFYWRKHPNLHGLMETIYIENGGEEHEKHNNSIIPGYNNLTMELTLEDIERIETHVLNDTLPYTEGFFFGQSYMTKEEGEKHDVDHEKFNRETKENDIKFIEKAKEALNEGFHLFYYPSW